ncbi:MAG: carboxylating nicotinate-nucleotide diphosphorylase [Myxococcota bacterium]
MNLRRFIEAALDEDVGAGDLTTSSCVPADRRGLGTIYSKEPTLVVSGQEPAAEVFRQVAERRGVTATYRAIAADGQRVLKGGLVAEVEAPLAVLLEGERLALNLMMKLSGIATRVKDYTDAAQGKLRVVDTRKTTPLLRELEKKAVRHGGAHNHRFALYDGVMIKDNHISAVGGITQAVSKVRANVHHLVRIEVEVTTLDELHEALEAGADVLLLDNMNDELLQRAVNEARAKRPAVVLEASGNITPERIARIRDFGLDVVSSGGLIHQAVWVDLSMDLRALPDVS